MKPERPEKLNLFTKIILTFFIYIIVYFIYFAFTFPKPDGDSINYHIPIAKSFLDGSFLNPETIKGVPFLKYSPGSSEGILSIFLFSGIPMQLFNVAGVLFLFGMLYRLGRVFGLEKNLSLVFAVSISSLPAMLRWINMEVIDIWMAGFFTLTLLLLEKPKKNLKYFLALGFSSGMLVGSKYSGPLFASVLFIFYFKKIVKKINIKHFLFFIIPFSVFGLFWYIRNFYFTGDPFYPQPFLFFKGDTFGILNTTVWKATLLNEGGIIKFIDAAFSEYSLWAFSFVVSIIVIYNWLKKRSAKKISKTVWISLIGLANFIIWLFLPSDKYFHIFVSVIRYSFPAIIPIMLCVFLFAKEKRKEELIYLVSFVSLLAAPIYEYHPKVLLIVFPISFLLFFRKSSQKS